MATYEEMLLAVIMDPPDPDEPLPPANRRNTIFGTVIGFLVCKFSKIFIDQQLNINSDSGVDCCLLSLMGSDQSCS